jgi:outer membrane lipoprotein-sorting protein
MKQLLILSALLLTGSLASAQVHTMTSPDESDPKAKALLDQIRQRYESYTSLAADFTLDITFPEQPTESQKGKLGQQGKKFKMEMASQTVLSNGETLWMIFDHNKEVQINDMPEEAEMGGMILSPESMLNFYDQGNFVYYITNEYRKNSRTVQQIEFKPVDRDLEYTKLRMDVDKSTKDVISVEAFGRDGSRYKLTIDKILPNKSFSSGYFTFNKSDYPDYYVEDLRY